MAKGIWAFEDDAAPPAPDLDITPENGKPEGVVTDVVETEIKVSEQTTEIEQTSLLIEQGETVREALQQMETAVTPEEKLEIATEAMLNLIGGTKGTNFSLEAFHETFNKNMVLAQEGILDTIKSTAFNLTTSRKKVAKLTEEALKNLKANGTKEGIISDFNSSSKLLYKEGIEIFDGAELAQTFNSYSTVLLSQDANKTVDSLLNIYSAIDNKSTNIDKDIFKFSKEINDLNKRIVGKKPQVGNLKYDVKFKPLTIQEAQKAVNESKELRKKIDQLLKDFVNATIGIAPNRQMAQEDFIENWSKEILNTLNSVGWWIALILLAPFALLWLAIIPLLRAIAKEDNSGDENNHKEIKRTFSDAYARFRKILEFYKEVEGNLNKAEIALYHYIKESTK